MISGLLSVLSADGPVIEERTGLPISRIFILIDIQKILVITIDDFRAGFMNSFPLEILSVFLMHVAM